jgi:hypothetical protein
MSDPDNPGECECCGYRTMDLTFCANLDTTIAAGGSGRTRKDHFWYCTLCMGTAASVAHRYPGTYSGQLETLRTVCYVGNAILESLQAGQIKLEEEFKRIFRELR